LANDGINIFGVESAYSKNVNLLSASIFLKIVSLSKIFIKF